ncbi:MAG: hypothetical protein RL215_3002 [Planctomycetota bacterium]
MGLLRSLCLMLLLPSVVMAQEPSAVGCGQIFSGDAAQTREMSGLQLCYNCHAAGSIAGEDALAKQLGVSASGGWILGNEVRIWGGEDRHSQAWATLRGETAQRIGRAMGREGTIHRDVRCLACHSAFPISQLKSEDLLVSEEVIERDPRVTQGVSCEGCHGAAGDGSGGDVRGWLNAHVSRDTWRYLKPEDKCRSGYSDVRSVASRTRICVSCHVGDVATGRVLTHEMYAAGHPPLPPFELETFEDLMPRHWKDFSDKGAAIQADFQAKSAAPMQPSEQSRARTTLIAGLATYAAFLRLTADLAEQRGFADRPELRGLGWPEFAQFDCYACHHDLRVVNWRQTEQAAGHPGRPRLTAWPSAIARSAVAANAGAGRYAELEQAVSASVLRVPFGDASALAADARLLAAECDVLASTIERGEWSGGQVQQALSSLLDHCDGTVPAAVDYDSARQYSWGFAVLESEISGRSREEAIAEWFGVDEANGGGVSTKTGVPLLLDLKIGEQVEAAIPGGVPRKILQIDSRRILPPIAGYDANQFREAFRRIRGQLPEGRR